MESAMNRSVTPLLDLNGMVDSVFANIAKRDPVATGEILTTLATDAMQKLCIVMARATDDTILDISRNEGADAAVLHHVRVQMVAIRSIMIALASNGKLYDTNQHPALKAVEGPVETETPIMQTA